MTEISIQEELPASERENVIMVAKACQPARAFRASGAAIIPVNQACLYSETSTKSRSDSDREKEADMVFRLKERLGKKLEEEVQFFKCWQKDKKGVGALMPTSIHAARRMASVVNPHSGLPVLELGAGTGVITRAILERGIQPHRLTSVEYSKDFYDGLVRRFPGVDFRLGNAFALEEILGERREKFDCVISAVPMLSFPMQQRLTLLEDLLARIPAGRPVIQITYGLLSPVLKMPDRYIVSHYDFVVRNVPPAQLWTYRRAV